MNSNIQVKPRVMGVFMLSLLAAIANIFAATLVLMINNGLSQESQPALTTFAIFSMILGVADLFAAILISRYKKLGLYITEFSYVVLLVTHIYRLVQGGPSLLWIVVDLIILYYVTLHLIHEPEKSYFS